MKNLLLIGFMSLSTPLFSQTLIDENTFVSSGLDTIRVGDDLSIGDPFEYGGFAFVVNDTKGKIGLVGKLAKATSTVGVGVLGMGVANLSGNAIMTGAKVATTAGTVSGIADVGDVVTGDNNGLPGRKMRILRFDKKGNAKRGEFFYAIVAGPKNQNYRIELIPAIENKEIIAVNNKPFK